ncbi:MAG: GNAT family N-acetyltransferase, partial [Candidatus Omnitrophota bacterium]
LTQGMVAACDISAKIAYIHPYFFKLSEAKQSEILYHEFISHVVKGIEDENLAMRDTNAFMWLNKNAPELQGKILVSLSMEGNIPELAGYDAQNALTKGGLGAYQGDKLEGAFDIGMQAVGIQPMYSHYIKHGQIRKVNYDDLIEKGLIQRVCNASGTPLTLRVKTWDESNPTAMYVNPEMDVEVFVINRGGTPVYLLKSEKLDLLYGDGRLHRFTQEIIFGKAAYQLMKELGLIPDILHLNEAHTVVAAALARADEAFAKTAIIYTNHTLVAAGLEMFSVNDICYGDKNRMIYQLGVSGKFAPECRSIFLDENTGIVDFCRAAMELADVINAVSPEHAIATAQLFKRLYGDAFDKPVIGILNGSGRSWQNDEIRAIEEEGRVLSVEELYEAHASGKTAALAEIKSRTYKEMNPSELMVWLIRRMVEYKSQYPILRFLVHLACADRNQSFSRQDLESLWRKEIFLYINEKEKARIYNHGLENTIQVVLGYLFANRERLNGLGLQMALGGPEYEMFWADEFRRWSTLDSLKNRFIYIPDSDANLLKMQAIGADICVTIPRPLEEACGTSDQRTGLGGGVNIAINGAGPIEWITDYNQDSQEGSGFLLDTYTSVDKAGTINPEVELFYQKCPSDLFAKLEIASRIYYENPKEWQKLMLNSYIAASEKVTARAMEQRYALDVYTLALAVRRRSNSSTCGGEALYLHSLVNPLGLIKADWVMQDECTINWKQIGIDINYFYRSLREVVLSFRGWWGSNRALLPGAATGLFGSSAAVIGAGLLLGWLTGSHWIGVITALVLSINLVPDDHSVDRRQPTYGPSSDSSDSEVAMLEQMIADIRARPIFGVSRSKMVFALHSLFLSGSAARNMVNSFLLDMLKGENDKGKLAERESVRIAAASALGFRRVHDPRVIKALVGSTYRDPSIKVRNSATKALGNIGAEAEEVALEPLTENFRRQAPLRSFTVTAVLQIVGAEKAAPILVTFITRPKIQKGIIRGKIKEGLINAESAAVTAVSERLEEVAEDFLPDLIEVADELKSRNVAGAAELLDAVQACLNEVEAIRAQEETELSEEPQEEEVSVADASAEAIRKKSEAIIRAYMGTFKACQESLDKLSEHICVRDAVLVLQTSRPAREKMLSLILESHPQALAPLAEAIAVGHPAIRFEFLDFLGGFGRSLAAFKVVQGFGNDPDLIVKQLSLLAEIKIGRYLDSSDDIIPFKNKPIFLSVGQDILKLGVTLSETELHALGLSRGVFQKIRSWEPFDCIELKECLLLPILNVLFSGDPAARETAEKVIIALYNARPGLLSVTVVADGMSDPQQRPCFVRLLSRMKEAAQNRKAIDALLYSASERLTRARSRDGDAIEALLQLMNLPALLIIAGAVVLLGLLGQHAGLTTGHLPDFSAGLLCCGLLKTSDNEPWWHRVLRTNLNHLARQLRSLGMNIIRKLLPEDPFIRRYLKFENNQEILQLIKQINKIKVVILGSILFDLLVFSFIATVAGVAVFMGSVMSRFHAGPDLHPSIILYCAIAGFALGILMSCILTIDDRKELAQARLELLFAKLRCDANELIKLCGALERDAVQVGSAIQEMNGPESLKQSYRGFSHAQKWLLLGIFERLLAIGYRNDKRRVSGLLAELGKDEVEILKSVEDATSIDECQMRLEYAYLILLPCQQRRLLALLKESFRKETKSLNREAARITIEKIIGRPYARQETITEELAGRESDKSALVRARHQVGKRPGHIGNDQILHNILILIGAGLLLGGSHWIGVIAALVALGMNLVPPWGTPPDASAQIRTQQQLIADIQARKKEVRQEFGYNFDLPVIVYGSYAENRQKPSSDVDISLPYLSVPYGSHQERFECSDRFEKALCAKLSADGYYIDLGHKFVVVGEIGELIDLRYTGVLAKLGSVLVILEDSVTVVSVSKVCSLIDELLEGSVRTHVEFAEESGRFAELNDLEYRLLIDHLKRGRGRVASIAKDLCLRFTPALGSLVAVIGTVLLLGWLSGASLNIPMWLIVTAAVTLCLCSLPRNSPDDPGAVACRFRPEDAFLQELHRVVKDDDGFIEAVNVVWLDEDLQYLYRAGYVEYSIDYVDEPFGYIYVHIIVKDPFGQSKEIVNYFGKGNISQPNMFYFWQGYCASNRGVYDSDTLIEHQRMMMGGNRGGEKKILKEWADTVRNSGSGSGAISLDGDPGAVVCGMGVIREAVSGDLAAIQRLARLIPLDFDERQWADELKELERKLEGSFLNKGYYFLVYEESGKVLGYIYGSFDLKGGYENIYIGEIAVHEDYQKRGVGFELSKEFIRRMSSMGAEVFEIDVLTVPCAKMVRRIGFEGIFDEAEYEGRLGGYRYVVEPGVVYLGFGFNPLRFIPGWTKEDGVTINWKNIARDIKAIITNIKKEALPCLTYKTFRSTVFSLATKVFSLLRRIRIGVMNTRFSWRRTEQSKAGQPTVCGSNSAPSLVIPSSRRSGPRSVREIPLYTLRDPQNLSQGPPLNLSLKDPLYQIRKTFIKFLQRVFIWPGWKAFSPEGRCPLPTGRQGLGFADAAPCLPAGRDWVLRQVPGVAAVMFMFIGAVILASSGMAIGHLWFLFSAVAIIVTIPEIYIPIPIKTNDEEFLAVELRIFRYIQFWDLDHLKYYLSRLGAMDTVHAVKVLSRFMNDYSQPQELKDGILRIVVELFVEGVRDSVVDLPSLNTDILQMDVMHPDYVPVPLTPQYIIFPLLRFTMWIDPDRFIQLLTDNSEEYDGVALYTLCVFTIQGIMTMSSDSAFLGKAIISRIVFSNMEIAISALLEMYEYCEEFMINSGCD